MSSKSRSAPSSPFKMALQQALEQSRREAISVTQSSPMDEESIERKLPLTTLLSSCLSRLQARLPETYHKAIFYIRATFLTRLALFETALSSEKKFTIFQQFHRATGIPPIYVALSGSIASLLMARWFFKTAASLFTNAVVIGYPALKTVESIEDAPDDEASRQREDALWKSYWLLYTALSQIKKTPLMSLIPFHKTLQFLLLLWAMHPKYQGALCLYEKTLKTSLTKERREALYKQLDTYYEAVSKKIISSLSRANDKPNTTITGDLIPE